MRCAHCGQENPERAKFCLECGTPFVGTGAVAGSRESRRTVTVVFADMVGFTTLAEHLDQESLRRVMDRFYAQMRAAIECENGTLAKFIGDAVLAVWGTPEVHEDDAVRAVRAAEGMRRGLAELNADLEERWGVRVGIRTGVNTGEVVVDPDRPADLLVGDTLNVAARLEQAAADGEVLIGPETYRLVRDHATLEPVEPLALKGKARPMPAWRVLDGLRADRRAEARLQAPLVGRDDELRRLRAAFDLTVASSSCRMVTVIGSPGLGKTRLVAEFAESVAAEAVVLRGRCEASGEGITFQPVAEVLRGAAGIGDEATPAEARDRLASLLPPDEAGRERVVERAAGLLGLAPVASTEETFWAVRRVLEACTRDRPVVLVHDDIHWGQPTFLDLLEHFVDWIRDSPVLVVGLARPELREVRPSLAELGRVTDVLALEPLDAGASRDMVHALLGEDDLPAELADRILETTEGNPLFLGEMLRMLADEGVLRRRGGRWIATGQGGGIAVPATIQALLAARIERLGSDERTVVERAAVIGHQFYRGAVSELAPPPVRPGVDDALATLSRKELVRPEQWSWLDEDVFRFHHILIRDAAYRSLLKEARAELHERFASWLEAKAGELAGEHEEVIAFHLEQALAYRLELGPLDDEGRELARSARARLHSAGRRALAREDLPAAVNLLRRALRAGEGDLPTRSAVLIDLAEALLSAGDTAAAEEIVEELGLAADEADDARLGAWATVFAGQLDTLRGVGHVRETAEAAAEAAEVLADAGDPAGEAKAHQVVAAAEAALGRVAAAEAALDRALVAARAADDRRRITAVLSGAPRAALWGPAPIVRASGRCLDVVRILRMTPGNRHVEAAALRCQAVLEAMRGRADAARGILDTCRMTFEELGLTLELHETAIHAGVVELLAGEPSAAEQQLRAAEAGFLALGVNGGAAQAAALLGRALLEQDRDDEALDEARLASERGGEDLKTTIASMGVRAEALARRGELEEALALAKDAVAMAEPTDALADKADAFMALAAVERSARDEAAAAAAAQRALDLYAAKDHSVGEARAVALAGGGPEPVGQSEAPREGTDPTFPPTGVELRHQAWIDAFNARDWEALEQAMAPDAWQRSHRALADEEFDSPEGMLAVLRSVVAMAADAQVEFLPLAATEDVRAGVNVWRGTTDGGAWEMLQGIVVVARGGRLAANETFDPAARLELLARYQELAAEHCRGPEGERLLHRFAAAFNARDIDAVAGCYAPDIVAVDRRAMGWQESRGTETPLEGIRGWWEAGPCVAYAERILEADGPAVVARVRVRYADAEVLLVWLSVFEGGLMTRREILGDEAAAIARFAELRGTTLGQTPLGRRLAKYVDAVNAADWDAVKALYAPDYALVDTRVLGWEDWDRDTFIANQSADGYAGPTRVRARIVAEAAHCGAYVLSFDSGSASEIAWTLSIAVVEMGIEPTLFSEIHEPDDGDGLLARFETFRALAAPGLTATSPELTYVRHTLAYDRRDWDAFRGLIADDVRLRDHRPIGWDPIDAADALMALQTNGVEMVPDLRMSVMRVLDRRDDAIAVLLRYASETMTLDLAAVSSIDERGRLVSSDIFDANDEPAILARLSELAGEPAWSARHAEHAARYGELFAPDTMDAVVDELYAPDLHFVDHRAVGTMGELDRDGFRAQMRSLSEGLQGTRAALEVFEVRGPQRLARSLVRGTHDEDGAAIPTEVESWYVTTLDDEGRIVLSRLFADERSARAWWESEDRAGASSGEATGDGVDVVRLAQEWAEAFNCRDWVTMRALLAHDYATDDLRPFGFGRISGVDAAMKSIVAIAETMDDGVWTLAPQDVRGDAGLFACSLAGTGETGGAARVDTLMVFSVRDGAITRRAVFDPEQRDLAEAELEQADLHTAGAEAVAEREPDDASSPAWRQHDAHLQAFVDAVNDSDEDALRAALAEDFEQSDHRSVGGVGLDADGFLAMLATARDVAPGMRFSSELLAVDGDRRVTRSTYTATIGDGGGDAHLVFFNCATLRGGRLVTSDMYETEEEARAAMQAGGKTQLSPVAHVVEEGHHPGEDRRELVGRARVLDSYAAISDAFNGRDWNRMAAQMTPECEWRDLRQGVRMVVVGPAAIADSMRAVGERSHVRWTYEVLEDEGDLALVRMTHTGTYRGGRYEVTHLNVFAGAPDGRIRLSETYEETQLDEARARLEALSARSPPDGSWRATHEEHCRESAGLYSSAASADLVERLYAPEFRLVDHRALGTFSELDLAGFREHVESIVGVADGAEVRADLVATAGRRRLVRLTVSGEQDGGSWELVAWNVSDLDPDGRVVRTDVFDEEQTARAWFAEGDEAPDVVEAFAAMRAAFNARDWDRYRFFFHEDFRSSDHRPGLRNETVGRAAMVASMRTAAGGGDVRWDADPIEVRGLGQLARARWSGTLGGAPFEVEYLDLHAMDERGQFLFNESFAPEQEDEARARLADWATHGASVVADGCLADVRQGILDAFNARDWARFEAGFAADYRWEDRRPRMRAEVRTAAAFTHMCRGMSAGDTRWESRRVDASARAELVVMRWSGTVKGAPWEVEVFNVARVDTDGLVDRGLLFELEQEAEARAAFAEFAAAAADARVTCASLGQAFNDRRWAALEKQLDDRCAWVDHRPGIRDEITGAAAYREVMERTVGKGDTRWEVESSELAPAAELSTVRWHGTAHGAAWEARLLVVHGLAADGRVAAMHLFELDQEAPAHALFRELGTR